MTDTTLHAWTTGEFEGLDLGDARWLRRLEGMVESAAGKPGGQVSSVFSTSAERQGAYALLEEVAIEPEALAAAMSRTTIARCANQPYVFVPLDGSSLNLTDKRAVKGFGPIGTYTAGARGIKVMSALAIWPDDTPVGLCHQTYWCRSPQKNAIPHGKRKVEDKETRYWVNAITEIRRCFTEAGGLTLPWFQLDQEGDCWPVFLAGLQPGCLLTVRAHYDRRIKVDGVRRGTLKPYVRQQEILGQYELAIVARPQRQARSACMEVRACQVTLDMRDEATGTRYEAEVWAVSAREIGTAPQGERPIEWLLLTNRSSRDFAEAMEVIHGYTQRWRIEDFHKIWKSGACDVEKTQLRSRQAVIKWAITLAVAATRIQRLMFLGRNHPTRPADEELTPYEIVAIRLLRQHNPVTSKQAFTIGQAVQCLAELGGYTGNSSGGPPGATVLARGLKLVQALAGCIATILEHSARAGLRRYDQ